MTPEEAIAFVEGMVKCVRPQPRDDDANEWARAVGWFSIFGDDGAGQARDHKEPDWQVEAEKIPAMVEAAAFDAGAFEASQRLASAHLRWGRPLPPSLASYVIRRLTGDLKRPHRKGKPNRPRDELAFVAIRFLEKQANITPDRNAATANQSSGIDITTEALRKAGYSATYDAIRTAYYRQLRDV